MQRAVQARITGGFWGTRQRVNGSVSIPEGAVQLERAGAIANFRSAAERHGAHQGEVNQDAEVYKWIEAASYELERSADETLRTTLGEIVAVVVRAQREDGLLHTWRQLSGIGPPFSGVRTGHADETYTAGHLIAAAVATARAVGDESLVPIAIRLADYIRAALVESDPDAVPGHPGIEMALVELYRHTGQERHLELARRFINNRGKSHLGSHRFGSSHYQDYLPILDAPTLTGHAVAALYLACGATDVAIETGDMDLLAALERQWEAVSSRKTYITGGVGSRHKNEDLGDDFELPSDRAYSETCAAVASAMWSRRLLLATGNARYANAIERVAYNGVLSGVAIDGRTFCYVNPLHVRGGHRTPAAEAATWRAPWFELACCPPNLMRFVASFDRYLATLKDGDLWIHQYATSNLVWHGTDGVLASVRMETDYPWDGSVRLRYSGPTRRAALALRIPDWCRSSTLTVSATGPVPVHRPLAEVNREWHDGDEIRLDLMMPPRLTVADPRVDALRGTVAIERGPLVYCVEAGDLDVLRLVTGGTLATGPRDPTLDVVTIEAQATCIDVSTWSGRLYRDLSDVSHDALHTAPITASAIPYFAWGNRGRLPMRVWLPVS